MDKQMEAQIEHAEFGEPVETPPAAEMGEAGFSLNWQMLDKDGAAVGATMRSPHAAGWREIHRQRAAFVAKATAGGWSFPARPGAVPPPSAPTAAAPTQPNNGHTPEGAPPQVSAPPAASAPTHTGDPLFVDVARVQVTPQAEGRVNLDFFMAGHKYADLKASKWPVTKAQAALSKLAAIDFAVANEYTVKWRVFFTFGKEYGTEGKRYRDICGFEALA